MSRTACVLLLVNAICESQALELEQQTGIEFNSIQSKEILGSYLPERRHDYEPCRFCISPLSNGGRRCRDRSRGLEVQQHTAIANKLPRRVTDMNGTVLCAHIAFTHA